MAIKAQYTIRGIGPETDRALRVAAKEKHMSLNRYLLHELERIAEETTEPRRYHDLDFAIGSMTDGDLVDEALAEFSKIDEDLWK